MMVLLTIILGGGFGIVGVINIFDIGGYQKTFHMVKEACVSKGYDEPANIARITLKNADYIYCKITFYNNSTRSIIHRTDVVPLLP